MLKPVLGLIVAATVVACSTSDPIAPDRAASQRSNTLVLLDSAQHTASFGATQLTGSSTAGPIAGPAGVLPGVDLELAVTQKATQASQGLVSCVDVQLYTKASGGTMVYSRNQAKSAACSAASGESSGPSGSTLGIYEIVSLQSSDLAPTVSPGTYYVRFHVTFPNGSAGEVNAGTVALF